MLTAGVRPDPPGVRGPLGVRAFPLAPLGTGSGLPSCLAKSCRVLPRDRRSGPPSWTGEPSRQGKQGGQGDRAAPGWPAAPAVRGHTWRDPRLYTSRPLRWCCLTHHVPLAVLGPHASLLANLLLLQSYSPSCAPLRAAGPSSRSAWPPTSSRTTPPSCSWGRCTRCRWGVRRGRVGLGGVGWGGAGRWDDRREPAGWITGWRRMRSGRDVLWGFE